MPLFLSVIFKIGVVLTAGIICAVSFFKRSLTRGGALLAFVMAVSLYFTGGLFYLMAMLTFYLS